MRRTAPSRRGGRPPRGVDRRQWHPRVSPALASALNARATKSGVKPATYREILISRALSFSSDRLDEIAVPLKMSPSSEVELATRVKKLRSSDFALNERGLTVRLPIKLDEPLAQDIEDIADRLGVSVSEYLRAIFRIAVGSDVEPVGTQDQLDVTIPKPVREEARLAS